MFSVNIYILDPMGHHPKRVTILIAMDNFPKTGHDSPDMARYCYRLFEIHVKGVFLLSATIFVNKIFI